MCQVYVNSVILRWLVVKCLICQDASHWLGILVVDLLAFFSTSTKILRLCRSFGISPDYHYPTEYEVAQDLMWVDGHSLSL